MPNTVHSLNFCTFYLLLEQSALSESVQKGTAKRGKMHLSYKKGALKTLFQTLKARNQRFFQNMREVFTSHGPTVIMPTWFCSREWFCHIGKFDEGGEGVPEDLLFFYRHLQKGGEVLRVDQCLLQYRYHPEAATHSVLEETIWNHRVKFLQDKVLAHWKSFTIWNAGKQGRKLYRSLLPANQRKVVAFCDVDKNKIAKEFYTYEESKERPKPKIPIQHFRDAQGPFIICVKLDLTAGDFEENLKSLNLKEGVDYFHFN
ncbi:queuosine-tRNA galactosyltransferase isoform X4 [Microcaecilia unicolor]|uniref:UDP-GlcNAc:betaGal beta-1,3-N-acetylglucosaminyltransferase-like protein 1 isoform X4 n=1 Tax=Microcaecilia unicolor TaxID=1415580 RepID=A0A6P7Y8U4_9AMPH|nr:UDP-GlcNAc:betaGal beta-1,3-N-acetylglucosaminyltransferase-like protein 1 isoform X4 [Microcaecilia unicolor]